MSLSLYISLLITLSCVHSALIRAPRDTTKTGKYIILLHNNVTEEEFNTTLQRALSLSQDGRTYVKVTHVEKAFVLDLNSYSAHQISQWPQVKLIEEETEAVGLQDPSLLWHLDQLDQYPNSSGVSLDHQFNPLSTGESVDIYVVDTGINYDHAEFGGRARYPGYDPYDASIGNPEYYKRGRDCNGHGTHVASLVGGERYGVAKRATIFSIKVLNCFSRAPWSVVIDGLDFIMKMVSKRNRPSVINMSLGGSIQLSVNEAVGRLVDVGMVIVVAAGNEKGDACERSPASSNKAITVGGTQQNQKKYTSTNTGPCVDIFAPGQYVRGAYFVCNRASVEYPNDVHNNCSIHFSGTSMASPLVAGVVALMLDREPLMSPSEVKAKLTEEAVKDWVTDIEPPTKNLFVNTPGSCGGYYPFRTHLMITSPGYPNEYPNDVVCEWRIPVQYNEDVYVIIKDFELEWKHDYLYLCQESEDRNCTSYTGQYSHFYLNESLYLYRTANANLTVRFVTDSFKSGRGFKLKFTKYYTNTTFQVIDKGEFLPSTDTTLLQYAVTRTHLNVGVANIRPLVNQMKSQNFDILSLSLTLAPPPNDTWYYAVVFRNSTQNPSVGFVELTSSELSLAILQQKKTGLIEYDITARLNETTPLYSIIFRKEPPYIESHTYWGVSLPSHVTLKVSMTRQGWNMVSQHFLTSRAGDNVTVSAIYCRDLRRVHLVPLREKEPVKDNYYGFPFSHFSHLTLQFLYQNYYAKSVSTYHHGNEVDARFSVVYEEKVEGEPSESYWIRWGLNYTKVYSEIAYFSYNWDIVSLTSYVYNKQLQYIMLWGRKIWQ